MSCKADWMNSEVFGKEIPTIRASESVRKKLWGEHSRPGKWMADVWKWREVHEERKVG